MSNLVAFPLRDGKETPERILQDVINNWGKLKDVVIIALNNENDVIEGSSCERNIETLGLIELGKHKINMNYTEKL